MRELTELQELKKSQTEGKWGFSVPYDQAASGVTMLSAVLPSYLSRAWTVTIGRQHAIGPNPLNIAAFPTAGFASPADPGAEPLNNQATKNGYVRVEWGNDSMIEQAYLDYRPQGFTFQVHGAFVRVSFNFPFNGAFTNPTRPALISGTLSPSARSTVDYGQCTYTSSSFSIVAGATLRTYIPSRAVAYRIAPNTQAMAAQRWRISQALGGAGGAVCYDVESSDASGMARVGTTNAIGDQEVNIYGWRQPWVMLVGVASMLQIEAAAANTSALQGQVQWLLDLG